MIDGIADLAVYPLEALISELGRRTQSSAIVLLTAMGPKGAIGHVEFYVNGSPYECLGLSHQLVDAIRAEIQATNISNAEAGIPADDEDLEGAGEGAEI
jgi:hypothetical protein